MITLASQLMDAIKYGVLTMADVAEALGVSRSTIKRRCAAAGIDPVASHRKFARRYIAKCDGRSRRAPTKAELRAKATRAVSTFVSDSARNQG